MDDSDGNRPLIVGFVADLMFSARIETSADSQGYRVRWVERADFFGPATPDENWRQPAEHITGRGAELIKQVVAWQPALMIFDLNNRDVPWRRWIALLKSVPATRRIPVICFGSHMDVETMDSAKAVGADVVLARSSFVSNLNGWIEKYARTLDPEALESACREPLSDLAIQGLELFNRGEYFESHERLEDAWNEDTSIGRDLYRAILQVGVAYLHIQRNNYRGAVKMFLRVRQWIEPLPDTCRGVEIARLREDASRVEQELLKLGPEGIQDFDRSLFKPVIYHLQP